MFILKSAIASCNTICRCQMPSDRESGAGTDVLGSPRPPGPQSRAHHCLWQSQQSCARSLITIKTHRPQFHPIPALPSAHLRCLQRCFSSRCPISFGNYLSPAHFHFDHGVQISSFSLEIGFFMYTCGTKRGYKTLFTASTITILLLKSEFHVSAKQNVFHNIYWEWGKVVPCSTLIGV